MAESSRKKLEDKRTELEAEQAKAVGALFDLNESDVDFDAAQNIGLIIDDTRAKIKEEFGEDMGKELFQAAMDKQMTYHKKPPVEAFKRAFEAVYGKFLLEQRDVKGLEKPDGPLMKVLGKVLRFPIEEIDGKVTIKGRPELESAVRRLSGILAEKGAAELLRGIEPNVVSDKNEAELEAQNSQKELTDLQEKKKKFDTLVCSTEEHEKAMDRPERMVEKLKKMRLAGLKKLVTDLPLKFRDTKKIREALNSLYNPQKKRRDIRPDKLKDLTTDLSSKFGVTKKTRAVLDVLTKRSNENANLRAKAETDFVGISNILLVYSLEDLAKDLDSKGAEREAKAARDAAKQVQDIIVAKPLDIDALENLLKGEFGVQVKLLTSGRCRKILGDNDKPDNLERHFELIKGDINVLRGFKATQVKWDKVAERISGLSAELSSDENYEFELKMQTINFLGQFAGNVKTLLLNQVPDEINEKIKVYLQNFSENITYDGANVPTEKVLEFVQTDYRAFVDYLDGALAAAVGQKASEKNDAENRLSELTKKVNRVGDFKAKSVTVEDILKKAFPGLTLDAEDEVKIRGFKTKFGHVAKQLDGAATFLSEPEKIEALDDNHKKLTSLGEQLQPDKLKYALLQILGDDARDISLDGNVRTQASIIEATMKALEQNRIQDAKGAKDDEKKKNQQARVAQGIKVGKLKDMLDTINEYLRVASTFHGELKTLVTHLEILDKAKIEMEDSKGYEIRVHHLVQQFNAIDPKKSDFDPDELAKVYEGFDGFFGDDIKVSALVKETKNAKKEIESNTGLTDAACAKKIIGALVARDNSDMPLTDQKKLSAMMLAGDVMKLQSAEDYVALAERGSADLLDTVKQVGFLEKVIGFQYKVGDKAEKPFEGLKPEQFGDWQKIENLFETRRLDYKGGFLLLAAFETFDGTRGEKSAQIGPLEQKLKELLAVALGVEDRMSEAGVVAIVNEAFEKQLEATMPLVQAYFGHVDKKRDVWETNRVRGLNTEHKALRDLYRTGSINTEQYRQRLEELREKAESAGVLDKVGFAQSSIMKSFADSEAGKRLKENGIDAGQALNVFWNNPVSQWFRDRGFDIARASGNAAGRILGHGAAGTVKLGASLGLQTALMPFRFGKYALMTAGMPFIGFVNLWRKQKWTPYSLKATVSQDVSRAIGYAGTTGKGIATGVAGTAKDVVAKDFVGAKGKKYKEKLKVEPDKAMERAKELWEKGQATPLKIASEPWIDLEKYKAKVKELDTILAGEKEKKAA